MPPVWRTIFSLGSVQALALVITTIRAKVFALLLGPAGFGVLATIDQLVVAASQFSNLSLPFTALKFLSRDHSLGEEEFRRSYSVFLRTLTGLALLATLAAVVLVSGNLADLDPQLAKYRRPVLIALFGIPATMLLVFFVNVLAARQKSLQAILLQTLFSLVVTAAGWIGCLSGGISGVYLATVPASTALILAMAVFARARMGLRMHAGSVAPRERTRVPVEIIGTAFFTYLAVCSHSFLLLTARYVSITRLSEEAAGLLQAGLAVALSMGAVLTPASSLYFTPYVNRALPGLEKAGAAATFLPRLLLLYCLAALPVLVLPELVLRLLFSDRFTAAAAILPWFVIWQCLFQVTNVYLQLLIGLDDVGGGCVITALGNLVAVALCLRLSGPFGLTGIAAAFVAGTFMIGVASALRLRSKHALALPRFVVGLAAYGVLGLAVVGAAGSVAGETGVQGAALRSAVAVVFLAGLWRALPRALRIELFRGATGRARELARWRAR